MPIHEKEKFAMIKNDLDDLLDVYIKKDLKAGSMDYEVKAILKNLYPAIDKITGIIELLGD
jgi:hypothetical protein